MTQLLSKTQSFPLSPIQQTHWFLYQLASQGLDDKRSIALRIQSPVDLDAIVRAFQQLIDRHPSLRSTFCDRAGQLTQEIRDTGKVDFDAIDVSNQSEQQLNTTLVQIATVPFKLEQESGLRVRLLSRSKTDHILLITVHKIASDEESLLILIDEILTIYNDSIQFKGENSKPLSLQERGLERGSPDPVKSKLNQSDQNWVQLTTHWLTPSQSEHLKTYWHNKLAGELPVLDLPGSATRPPLRTYNGSASQLKLDRNITQNLNQLAQQSGASLDTLLLAAFKVLLYRYTGESDILVGMLNSPRNQPEFTRTIGDFSNIVVTRDEITGNQTFTDVLRQVNQTVTETKDYQDYPFPQLVKELPSASNLSHSPICQASFTFQNWQSLPTTSQLFEATANNQLTRCGTLEVGYFQLHQHSVEFDISLEIIQLTDSLLVSLQYNSDLFDTDTISQIIQHYQNLLTAIITTPNQPVGSLPVLSKTEQQYILQDWNATQTDYNLSRCLHHLIEAQVEKTPDAIAVIFDNQQLTYRQLNSRANQLAHYLQKLGVKPESLVGICVERSLEMVVGLLAILKAGGAYVPIDPNYPVDRIAYMLADSQVPVLLTQEPLVPHLPKSTAKIICLDTQWDNIAAENNHNPDSTIQPENLAYVIYTSGSTGKPKGAMNTHQGICNRLLWMQQTYHLTPADSVLQKTPFSFDVSVWEFFWTLMTGASLVVAKPGGHQDSRYLVEIITQQQITTLHFVPSMLQLFLEEPDINRCQSLKRVICSGEALPLDLQNRFFSRLDCELHNLYGPTEAAIDVTYWQCQRNSKSSIVPIGRPVANTQIYILDPYLHPVPIGVPGEIHIGGVQVARGYLNRPELTQEKFIANPFQNPSRQTHHGSKLYKTGDLARYRPDGTIEYLRRIDHQVKIRGFRIELGEIENALTEYPQIREAVVIARTEKSGGKQLVAYFVSTQEKPSPRSLRSFLKESLPDYMIPAAFVSLDSLPLTPNGKVNRRALPAPNPASFGGETTFIAPRNHLEQQLAKIWSDLLDIDKIGINDNFFERGGHSLLALKLMGKIQHQFGQTLPLTTLFTSPTIAELANVISHAEVESYSAIVPIQTQGSKPPFFCVHPAGGNVLCYLKLADYLGTDQPFYGLQAQGFNQGEEALTQVEDMAHLYVKAIREVQPEGPYQIGGWSFGGIVAYEIAQQLQKQGEEVSRLAILDSWVPIILDQAKKIDDHYLVGVCSRVFGGMFGQDNLVSPDELQGLTVPEQIDYILAKAQQVGVFPTEGNQEQNRRILDVLVGTLKATYAYKRQPYPSKVTVFRAQEKHLHAPDPQLVWVELFAILDAKEIDVIPVPGHHYSFILEPNVRVLAERLAACLN
ncbi:amino acid adenylation domain-containing protein [Coleofasciculus sp. F4-SAH-05]|uniref:amino acid adenylation domain-containing protein n=1 Tax=Coleofasciculus sp. F4-SAH-05 TaxID=3069525 RepID=UPI0032F86B66